eukprot:GHVU01086317.1.p2 GENE.GHVU01086317.1~~GHVU01086317.1.p2  ORF type:complete len:141 (+),score=17.75 GHVU01086317.1:318-740(+)
MQHITGQHDRGRDNLLAEGRRAALHGARQEQIARAIREAHNLAQGRVGDPEGAVNRPERAGMTAIGQQQTGQREMLGKPTRRVRAQKAKGHPLFAGTAQGHQTMGHLFEAGIIDLPEMVDVIGTRFCVGQHALIEDSEVA